MTAQDRTRNFAIISHIDHGKTTLSDRILELTHAVEARDMRAQYLDSMDIERERGITIKAQNVRLTYKGHTLHLIDTPGHVDFGYEVSRSLAACEGVVLLVDASQGIEAQTLANCYQALEHDLTIVAALNKIDLPAAEPERVAGEIERVLGIPAEEILLISAKTGEGVPELLDAVIERIPRPTGDADAPLQSLIFDSYYDPYRGVVSAVRVFNGTPVSGARLKYLQADAGRDAEEIGVRLPRPTPVTDLGPGAVGSLLAGIKDVGQAPSEPGRVDRGAVRRGHDAGAGGVRRHAHGARAVAPRRDEEDGVPVRGPGRARLRPPTGRDRSRLLRPAEVPHPRIREPRLRACRLSRLRPRQGRRPSQQRPRRRVLRRRASRPGLRVRAAHDREAARAHPAPAVRRAHPGRHRRAHHRPRDGQGPPQGRDCQVLRRRRHAQAQAPRAAKGGQAAHEADRTGRGPPGGLRRRVAPGGLGGVARQ